MAHEPTSATLNADYDALMAQLAAMRDELTRLTTQIGTTAIQNGKAMADTMTADLHDAQRFASSKAHDANAQIGQAVASNPYLALGAAAGLGLLLGALTRR